MGITTNYMKQLFITGLFMLALFSSCKKDDDIPVNEVEINLPSTLTLVYGEEKDIAIPAELLSRSDINFSLEFSENENVQINAVNTLHDQLAKAITIDKTQGKLHVNGNLIYPNGTVSSTSGKKLPDSYKITLTAKAANQAIMGKQTIGVTVTPATFNIKGLDNKADIPFGYVLYSDAGVSFELESAALSLTGTAWYLDNKGAETVVSLNGNKIQFKENAGDPNKKAEYTYDLVSTLKKDGFDVALRKFRVIFIPQIKFFYGTYYPEYDLTVLLNQIYIALSNAYVSSAPTLYPEKYKSTFSIVAIQKDGNAFVDSDNVFQLNDKTGAITVKKNTTLTAGSYKLTIKAVTTTGLEFSSTMTLNMSKLEE